MPAPGPAPTTAATGKPAGISWPPSTGTGWWQRWTDRGRTGGNAEGEGRAAAHRHLLPAGPRPSNFRMVPHLARMGLRAMDMGGAWSDQDLGASGIVLIESLGIG